MEWPKLKNIIILLLTLTNLCLLAFVVRQEWQDRSQEQEARNQALAFLSGKGVELDERDIPDTMSLLPCTVERDLEWEKRAARTMLRDDVELENRGGEVYRYSNENGAVQFHSDGAFSAQLVPGAFPLGEDRVEDCMDLLDKLGFKAQLLREEGDRLVFQQLWNGVPLFSHQVTLECGPEGVTAMTGGRRLMGEPVEDTGRKPVTVATALFDFYNGLGQLGDVCSRIDRIDRGYISTMTLSGPGALKPVWRIDTDTASYQLDVLTGGLSRLGSNMDK